MRVSFVLIIVLSQLCLVNLVEITTFVIRLYWCCLFLLAWCLVCLYLDWLMTVRIFNFILVFSDLYVLLSLFWLLTFYVYHGVSSLIALRSSTRADWASIHLRVSSLYLELASIIVPRFVVISVDLR